MKQIAYQEVSTVTVMKFYGDSFTPKRGQSVQVLDWFVDTAKNTVIFKLLVDQVENPIPHHRELQAKKDNGE